jgi:hypothetical protein
MRTAYLLLLGLIGISPALLFVDGPMIHSLLVAYAAVATGMVGASIRPREMAHLTNVIRPAGIFAVIVAIWLLVQVMPLPNSWGHPIWADAEAALGAPMVGFLTIDPGATVVAICRYFSTMAILFIATAVSIDRLRAARILSWLVGATTFAATAHIIHGLIGLDFLDRATDIGVRESTTALSVLGVILAAAAAVRAMEHYEVHRNKAEAPFNKFTMALTLGVLALGICASSLVGFSRTPVNMSALSGLSTLVILVLTRRLGFGPWVAQTIAAVAIGIVTIIVIAIVQKHAGPGSVLVRYALQSQSSLISMTERIIGDTGWSGTGGGTFELLLPIYGASSSDFFATRAPTTVAQLVVELGWPAFAAIVVMALVVVFLLLRGALQRGRDSFYSAAGAGCIVALTFQAFCDDSLFNTAVLLCAVAALGVGLAQRVSRAYQ